LADGAPDIRECVAAETAIASNLKKAAGHSHLLSIEMSV